MWAIRYVRRSLYEQLYMWELDIWAVRYVRIVKVCEQLDMWAIKICEQLDIWTVRYVSR